MGSQHIAIGPYLTGPIQVRYRVLPATASRKDRPRWGQSKTTAEWSHTLMCVKIEILSERRVPSALTSTEMSWERWTSDWICICQYIVENNCVCNHTIQKIRQYWVTHQFGWHETASGQSFRTRVVYFCMKKKILKKLLVQELCVYDDDGIYRSWYVMQGTCIYAGELNAMCV